MKWTVQNQLEDTKFGRPHIVILGAGASKQALPNGDKNGRVIPLMDSEFIKIVGLEDILKKHQIPFDGIGFEELYSDLYEKPEFNEARKELESAVRNYFSSLRLPDHPTLYDHLVLSLRPKDVIATFNWDPFLFQACQRNFRTTKLPITLYLHGCVSLGVDLKNKLCGPVGELSRMNEVFQPTPILFPIKKKDYNSDPYISSEWRTLTKAMQSAFVLTIFGYGAPKSDVEAISLMKTGWGKAETRELEETEIIDIREEEQLLETWDGFIHTHHYQVHKSFYDSTIGRHPRRSCESIWARTQELFWDLETNCIPHEFSHEELKVWIEPFLKYESKKDQSD